MMFKKLPHISLSSFATTTTCITFGLVTTSYFHPLHRDKQISQRNSLVATPHFISTNTMAQNKVKTPFEVRSSPNSLRVFYYHVSCSRDKIDLNRFKLFYYIRHYFHLILEVRGLIETCKQKLQTLFAVHMTCDSCVKSVSEALLSLDGITKVDANLKDQLVAVEGTGKTRTILLGAGRQSFTSSMHGRHGAVFLFKKDHIV
jgi:copper chaperone CopZ